MGIYIFNWDVLKKYLIEDEADPKLQERLRHEHHPRPCCVTVARCTPTALPVTGATWAPSTACGKPTWKCWTPRTPASISLIRLGKFYSRNPVLPAQKIGERAIVQDSLITEGCKIYGNVKHSVLSAGVVVEEGATVEDAVLMDGVVVKAGAVVKRCILAEDVVVGAGAKVGGEGAIAHVGTGLTIGAGATVKEGAKVFESVKEGMEVC